MRRLFLWTVMAGIMLGGVTFVFANNNFIAGGNGGTGGFWEIRNSNGKFVSSGNLWATRASHCTVQLANGNMFLAGGSAGRTHVTCRSSEMEGGRCILFDSHGDFHGITLDARRFGVCSLSFSQRWA